ncbi:MAG: nucleotide exchange factor GrpE [Bacteroidetes bacterium]|nr:nucleotide exchange factor GrpE [Bacteroidota bacterium]
MSTNDNNTVEETTNSAQEEAIKNEVKENAEEQTAQKMPEEAEKEKDLQAKINELNDRYLRLYSEFDNYRKRTAKERIELSKTAGEDILKSFLPIVDDFERGIKMNETISDVKTINEGFQLIYNKLKTTLVQKGVEPMESIGKEFDADIHEAITNIPAPSDELKGKIVDEVEKGYSLHGKVIRFAKVIVGN